MKLIQSRGAKGHQELLPRASLTIKRSRSLEPNTNNSEIFLERINALGDRHIVSRPNGRVELGHFNPTILECAFHQMTFRHPRLLADVKFGRVHRPVGWDAPLTRTFQHHAYDLRPLPLTRFELRRACP